MIVKQKKTAVTLLELLVVVMIMGILASVAVTVYTGHVDRARVAACRDTIRQLELAVNRYEVDTGQLPPSSSGLTYAPDSLVYEGNATQGSFGSGYMRLALVQSLSGNMYEPLHYRWLGPYLELDEDQIGDRDGMPVTASTPKGYVQILDPWGLPFYYIKTADYSSLGGTEYPNDHPFYATETYYNPSSFQIFSQGRNGSTYPVPYRGEETDDVTNWRRYGARYAAGSGGGGRSASVSKTSRSSGGSGVSSSIKVQDADRNSGRGSGEGYDRRPVKIIFQISENGNSILFQWPEGWEKRGDFAVSEDGDRWLFQNQDNKDYSSLGQRYTNISGAEILYEGGDPQNTIDNAYVLEVKSRSTPEGKLSSDAADNPYHLMVAFKEGDNTCWWAANFSSYQEMETGRLFISGIVRTRSSVTMR